MENTDQLLALPNDIAEVDEEEVIQCLEYAVLAAGDANNEIQGQRNALARLLADFKTNDANSLGFVIAPNYFRND